jgi:exodeoxyribonuclease VII small subunit
MAEEKGFNVAYQKLKANAEKLRNQSELDIDGLVPIVQESAAAYAICKERIAAVRATLAEHLNDSNAEDDESGPF